MDMNKVMKNVLWGISALAGLIVAEGIYRTGVNTINKRELIGDGEVISDEIEDLEEDLDLESTPFS